MKKFFIALMLGMSTLIAYSQKIECETKTVGSYTYEWKSSMYSPNSSEPNGPSCEEVQNIIERQNPHLNNLKIKKVSCAGVSTYAKRPSDHYLQKTTNYYLTYNVPDHKKNIKNGLAKALSKIKKGSIVSVNQVSLPKDLDLEEYKETVTDILMQDGYRVVAKEYLQRLYEEQKQQQSGVYNDQTTVQSNNFSAVGYFVNVKINDEYMRIQVINVSTGEYDGTASIDFYNR